MIAIKRIDLRRTSNLKRAIASQMRSEHYFHNQEFVEALNKEPKEHRAGLAAKYKAILGATTQCIDRFESEMAALAAKKKAAIKEWHSELNRATDEGDANKKRTRQENGETLVPNAK